MIEDSSFPPGKARPAYLVLLYDGRCGVCRGSMRWLLHGANRIEAIDLNDPEATRRFPGLSRDELARQLHGIDDRGRVYLGARAVAEALRYRSGATRHLARLGLVPGVAPLAQLIYRGFATRRHRAATCTPDR